MWEMHLVLPQGQQCWQDEAGRKILSCRVVLSQHQFHQLRGVSDSFLGQLKTKKLWVAFLKSIVSHFQVSVHWVRIEHGEQWPIRVPILSLQMFLGDHRSSRATCMPGHFFLSTQWLSSLLCGLYFLASFYFLHSVPASMPPWELFCLIKQDPIQEPLLFLLLLPGMLSLQWVWDLTPFCASELPTKQIFFHEASYYFNALALARFIIVFLPCHC